MLSILIIFFVLAAAASTVYRLQSAKPDARREPLLPPPDFSGLFTDKEVTPVDAPDEDNEISRRRASLLERAAQGNKDALLEAQATGDGALYKEILDNLVTYTETCQESLPALVAFIAKNDQLRGNARLARRAIEMWKAAPDRRSTIEMAHIAALSDDPATYETAIETALRFWREGRLSSMTAKDLQALIESQYWALAPEARQGGAGFALKQRIAGIRRELAVATPAR